MKPEPIRHADLAIRFLGPFEVTVHGQPLPKLRSQKSLWALALLAMRGGRPVQREWLASTLWPDSSPDIAFANLRPVLSDLKSALGSEGIRLQSPNRSTIVFDPSDADVDLVAFESAIGSQRRTDLERAVALYRGPLLEGCREEWVHQERSIREQQAIQVLQRLAEMVLAAGESDVAIELFRRAVGIDPWRDSARRGLMSALAKSGDTNAALRTYREFAAFIQTEGKATPDEATTALYTRLRQEVQRRTAAPPLATEHSAQGYVPSPLTEIIGREDEREEVLLLLRQSRLVTMTGPGGIGKTRLAIDLASEVARDYPDGVWFVALEAITEGDRIPTAIASVLKVQESVAQSPLKTLIEHLSRKRALLVIDNCEHVIEGCANVIASVLRECGDVRVLATSRESLGIAGEAVWLVPSLAVPDMVHLPKGSATLQRVLMGYESVRLFVHNARSASKGFDMTAANALLVAEVCVLLEGIPLAIELAAAWVKSKPLAVIVAHVKDNMGLLDIGVRAPVPRQQTLRSTIDWSYRLLSDRDRLLLQRLAIFTGGWTLSAAERVCSGQGISPTEISASLDSLIDKSLISFESYGKDGDERYKMLETVRQFMLEALSDEERRRLVVRHRRWFVEFCDVAGSGFTGGDQKLWMRRLKSESANLLFAMDFDDESPSTVPDVLRIAGALGGFWCMTNAFNTGGLCLERAVKIGRLCPNSPDLGKVLHWLGRMRGMRGDGAAAAPLQREALAIAEESGDLEGVADTLLSLGDNAQKIGDFQGAQDLYTRCLEIYREIGDHRGVAMALDRFGSHAILRGDFVEAKVFYVESEAVRRMVGHTAGVAWCQNYLGNVALSQGIYEEAIDHYKRSLPLFEDAEDPRGVAWSVFKLGETYVRRGQPDMARPYLEEGLARFAEFQDQYGSAWSTYSLGDIAFDQGSPSSALKLYEETMQFFLKKEDRRSAAIAKTGVGMAVFAFGEVGRARSLLLDSLRDLVAVQDTGRGVECLEALVSVLLSDGAERLAGVLLGFAASFRERKESLVPLRLLGVYERDVSRARVALGDSFDRIWEEGVSLSWEEAVGRVLGHSIAEQAFLG